MFFHESSSPSFVPGMWSLQQGLCGRRIPWTIGPPSSKVLAPPWRAGPGPQTAGLHSTGGRGKFQEGSGERKGSGRLGQVTAPGKAAPSPLWCCQHQPHPLGDQRGDLDPAELCHPAAGFFCLVQLIALLHLECEAVSWSNTESSVGEGKGGDRVKFYGARCYGIHFNN